VTSWRRHDTLVGEIPLDRIDLMIVGDSLAEYWPGELWAPWRVFNFGIAADKTQHAIWRLDQIEKEIVADRMLVVLGTNNLGAGDTPEGIVAGIRAVVRRLAELARDATIVVLEVPPCGPGFDFRGADRKLVNRLLRQAAFARTINIDEAMTNGFSETSARYLPDNIHFSAGGYETATALVRERFL
jgi:lysophospholipase L1-like esterase